MKAVAPPPNTIEVYKTEEKGSDVNLASHLLVDAAHRDCEVAVVVSNDSDLKDPIELAQTEFGIAVCGKPPPAEQAEPCSEADLLQTAPEERTEGLPASRELARCSGTHPETCCLVGKRRGPPKGASHPVAEALGVMESVNAGSWPGATLGARAARRTGAQGDSVPPTTSRSSEIRDSRVGSSSTASASSARPALRSPRSMSANPRFRWVFASSGLISST